MPTSNSALGTKATVGFAWIAVWGIATSIAPAATFQLQEGVFPTPDYVHEDALIRDDNGLGDTIPGAAAGLLVGSHPGSGTGNPAPGHLRGLVEFDLTPIAADIGSNSIVSVAFMIPLQATTAGLPRVDGTPIVNINSYGFPVLPGTATWNDPDGDGNPSTGDTMPGGTVGTFLGTFGELSSATTIQQTLTGAAGSPLVAAFQTALASDLKLRLILVEDQADTATRDIAFFGSSALAASRRPMLTIETASTAYPGDFDGDGDVDGADFVAWQTNFPKAGGALLSEGDADGDGDVDGADFVVWQTNFPFTPGPGAAPVPEPNVLILAASGGFGIGWRSWSRRSIQRQK